MIDKIYLIVARKIRSDGLILGAFILVARLFQRVKSAFYSLILDAPGINLGSGCQIYGARFIQFGRGISVYQNLWLEAVTEYRGEKFSPVIKIGDRVSFSNGVHISAINKITIGNDVLFGSNVYLSDHNHGSYMGKEQSSPHISPSIRTLISNGEVIVEDNVWFGDNVNVVGPVRVGYGAIIAANSVVRKDVPPQTIVAGAPARVIKTYNELTGKWESN